MTIQELQRERARLWDVFMEQGGRGVDLADRIDALDAKMLDEERKVFVHHGWTIETTEYEDKELE